MADEMTRRGSSAEEKVTRGGRDQIEKLFEKKKNNDNKKNKRKTWNSDRPDKAAEDGIGR